MTPDEPETKPPLQSIVDTFGFHSPHVDMSDQIRHTLSGDAEVSTVVPYSRAIAKTSENRYADRTARSTRARGTSTTCRVLRKFSVTTPLSSSTAPTISTVRSGTPCPTGGGIERIRNSASGYPSSATVASD